MKHGDFPWKTLRAPPPDLRSPDCHPGGRLESEVHGLLKNDEKWIEISDFPNKTLLQFREFPLPCLITRGWACFFVVELCHTMSCYRKVDTRAQ